MSKKNLALTTETIPHGAVAARAAGRADKELKALHITSIRELGTWKFALWSEALVSLAEFETADFSS